MQRIIHDAAYAASVSLFGDLQHLFHEDEKHAGWVLIFETIKAAIEAAFIAKSREIQKLKPCSN